MKTLFIILALLAAGCTKTTEPEVDPLLVEFVGNTQSNTVFVANYRLTNVSNRTVDSCGVRYDIANYAGEPRERQHFGTIEKGQVVSFALQSSAPRSWKVKAYWKGHK